jgi:putative NIF3 family GTP cyclohydrolase 1 type 2
MSEGDILSEQDPYMNLTHVSRRRFALLAGSLAVGRVPLRGAAVPSANDIAKQIREHLGGDWPDTGLDGFKAGSPETAVRGIATTAMATMDVLRQASKAGLNLIVTHEPTFYGIRDGAPPVPGGRGPIANAADDPVLKAKKEFIEKNNLVVLRLHDHWQARKESDLTGGLADSLGWSGHRVPGEVMMYDIPAATLEDTVAMMRKKLNLRGGLRAVGDPKTKVHRVMLHPGLMTVATMFQNFGKTDLLVAGEVREWECVLYAADMNTAGEKRSLVTLGRVASEEPGMRLCASWLKTVIKGVPVQWIGAGDPYWRAV